MSLFKTITVFQIQYQFLFFFILYVHSTDIQARLLSFIFIMDGHQLFV